jgi:hypothetical protein
LAPAAVRSSSTSFWAVAVAPAAASASRRLRPIVASICFDPKPDGNECDQGAHVLGGIEDI